MSKIVNPSDKPVGVARWVIAPKGSKAVHSITGETVNQLSDKVAALPVVQNFVKRGILQEEGAAPKEVVAPSAKPTKPERPHVANPSLAAKLTGEKRRRK